MRQAIRIAVFSGMLGVTFFGLFLTPVFFVTIEKAVQKHPDEDPDSAAAPTSDSGPALTTAGEPPRA
jgi:hypothetical protein